MAKQKVEDRDSVTSRDGVTVAIRLSPREDKALKALVALEQEDIDSRGAPYRASSASVLKTLLRARAMDQGVWEGVDAGTLRRPGTLRIPVKPELSPTASDEVVDPRQRTIFDVPNVEKSAPAPTPQAKNTTSKKALTSEEGVAWLIKVREAGVLGKDLGVLLGYSDGAMVSRWMNGTRMSDDALCKLEEVLPKLRKDYHL